MTGYIHQLPDWPKLHWDQELLAGPLAEIRHRQGWLLGRMAGLGFAVMLAAGFAWRPPCLNAAGL